MRNARGWTHRNEMEPESSRQDGRERMGREMRAGERCTPESRLRVAPGLAHSTGLGVFSRGCTFAGPRRRLPTGSCWAWGLLGPG